MEKMQYLDLLKALDLEERMDLAEVDRTGSCTLFFGDKLELTVERDRDGDLLRLFAPLGPLRRQSRAKVLAQLMAQHARSIGTGGAYFGFDEQLEQVNIFTSIDLRRTDLEGAIGYLSAFVDHSMECMQSLPAMEG
jgi:hypothetical protein